MLAIWLNVCAELGVSEVLINLHAHADAVRKFLHQNERSHVHVRVAEEPELLGSAGTLAANRNWVSKENLFWIFYADVLHCADLSGMLQLHRQSEPAATLGVYEVPDPSRCGVVTVNAQNIVQDFVEKPANPTGNLAFAGLMIGTPKLLDVLPAYAPSDIGSDVLPRLKNQMMAFPIKDYLIDVGTLENYHKAQATWPGYKRDDHGTVCT